MKTVFIPLNCKAADLARTFGAGLSANEFIKYGKQLRMWLACDLNSKLNAVGEYMPRGGAVVEIPEPSELLDSNGWASV